MPFRALSGVYKKVALTPTELASMTASEIANHIMGLSPPPVILLGAIFDYLRDKPDVYLGLFKRLGLLKTDSPVTDSPTTESPPDSSAPGT